MAKYSQKKVRKPKCKVTADSIEQVKDCARTCGSHYFEPATMRFFASRVGQAFHDGRGGAYFVTSEQFKDHMGRRDPRRWSISYYNPNRCNMTRIGKFQQYSSGAVATRVAKKIAAKSKKRRRGYRMDRGRRLKGAR